MALPSKSCLNFYPINRFLLIGALASVGIVGFIAAPTLARRDQQPAQPARDLPQSQRALRIPTRQNLEARLPDGALQVLERCPQLTLFSLDPGEGDYDTIVGSAPRPMFHDHAIKGQTVIDADDKAALLASFYDGFVPPPSQLKQVGFGCFNPRHGIRATHDGKTVDLLICFGCMKYQGYLNDHQFAVNKGITNAPAEKFKQILTGAGIAIAR